MRLFKRKIIGLCSLALFFAFSVSTGASANEPKPFIIGGLSFGGENLVNTSGADLTAGGFIYAGGGMLFEPDDSDLLYQVSLGYKFDMVEFSGPRGDSKISVLPLDVVAFYKMDKLLFGAGLAYYLNPQWEFCFDGGGCATTDFDNALGLVLELRRQWNDTFWGARYTDVEYEVGSASLDASNFRIHFGLLF